MEDNQEGRLCGAAFGSRGIGYTAVLFLFLATFESQISLRSCAVSGTASAFASLRKLNLRQAAN